MDIKINVLENCKRELEAELSFEELIPHFENGLKKYRKKLVIPGFRKGKAPLDMVKKLYNDAAEYDSLEDIANEVFKNYIQENKIALFGTGSITELNYKPKERLNLKIQFEIFDEVSLENLDKIEVTKTKLVIDDSLVEEELDYIKLQNAAFEIDGQATDELYRVTVDSQELDADGNPIEGKSEKDLLFYLNSDFLSKDYRKGLKGIKENETRILDTTNREGEKVKLQLTCTKVEKIIYPELNEENIKKFSNNPEIKTIEEFKSFLKVEIEKAYNNQEEEKFKDSLTSEAIKISDIKIPEQYSEQLLNILLENHKKEHKGHKHPINEEEYKNKHRGQAIFTGKWFALKSKILETEKFEITDSDYEKFAQKISAQYNIPVDRLVEMYKKNEEVRDTIINDKIVDYLASKAKVTEIEEVKKSILKMAEEKKEKK